VIRRCLIEGLARVEQHVSKLTVPAIPEGMQAIKIRADAKFWRHWHGNKAQMRQIGYRCRKVGKRWHAWLLVKDERVAA
jgi:hypothetical protein